MRIRPSTIPYGWLATMMAGLRAGIRSRSPSSNWKRISSDSSRRRANRAPVPLCRAFSKLSITSVGIRSLCKAGASGSAQGAQRPGENRRHG